MLSSSVALLSTQLELYLTPARGFLLRQRFTQQPKNNIKRRDFPSQCITWKFLFHYNSHSSRDILLISSNLKMKFTLAIALIGAVLAVVSGAPAANAVDWDGISLRIRDIQIKIQTNYQQVISLAKGDNLSIGGIIEGKLEARIAEIRLILNQVNAAVSGRSLTESQATEHFDNVEGSLSGAFFDVVNDVSRLSPNLHTTIFNLISYTSIDVNTLAQEIFELLRQ